jgi:predicted secreted Zn-dependent protease
MVSLPAFGEPVTRLHTSYYYIDGSSATRLAGQIEQKGPPGADGKRYPAQTKWNIQWKLRHVQEGVSCNVKEAAVLVGVAQIMPRWRGEAQGSAALKARWQKFVEAVKRHEDVHKDNAIKAGKEIESALLAVKPHSNCEDLTASANAMAEEIVGKYRKLDEDYDRSTNFGRSQGATLI